MRDARDPLAKWLECWRKMMAVSSSQALAGFLYGCTLKVVPSKCRWSWVVKIKTMVRYYKTKNASQCETTPVNSTRLG